MKRKILFMLNALDGGGVSKSLVSLLNVIDTERYDVTLMLINDGGPLKPLLPVGIKIYTNPVWEALSSRLNGIPTLLKKKPHLVAGHIAKLIMSKINRGYSSLLISKMMPALEEEFDVAIDYGGQFQLYYMIDKLKAKKKITFFHSDYSQWPQYYSVDKKYYKKADRIFLVSRQCVDSMKKWFPDQSDKIDLMENISSLNLIEKLAQEEAEGMDSKAPAILTVGRVTEAKGTDLALQAADILKRRGVDFHWYFLGKVFNPTHYAAMVKKHNLEDRVTFLGLRTNPYPFIKKATIIAHPSKFEGKSIALDEAKLLLKPTVATNFSTVNDQFTHGHTATVCEMTPDALADAVEELLLSKDLRNKYAANLLKERVDNVDEINKLYKIIDPI